MRRHLASTGPAQWMLLAALAALSLVVQAELLWTLFRDGGAHTGSDGLEISDQAQYLAWARLASNGLLLANPFDLAPGTPVWLHPGFALCGGLTALGLSPGLALLLWKPVALVILFTGAVAYARRLLPGRRERGVGVALALLAGSPILAGLQLGQLVGPDGAPGVFAKEAQIGSIAREMWPVAQLWGFPFAAITIGLMPLVLLAYEGGRSRLAEERPGGWMLILAYAGTALCAWVHPWQGATVAGTAIAAELWPVGDGLSIRRRARAAVPLALAVALPLSYLWLLGYFDEQWRQVRDFTEQGLLRWDYLLGGLVPLGLVALLALRRPAKGFGERALRLWVPVALLIYLLPGLSFRQHALEGLSLPLSLLAVQGIATLDRPWLPTSPRARQALVWACLALMIVPITSASLLHMHQRVQRDGQPHVIRESEAAALDELAALPEPGGVLSTTRLSQLVPGRSGRETWLGPAPWTPDLFERQAAVAALFSGDLSPRQAREVVARSGARIVLSDCDAAAGARDLLAPLVRRTVQFGCASVYVLR